MASNRAEVVRGIYDQWARGNFRDAADLYDPHVVLVLRLKFPDAGAYYGKERIASYTRDLLASYVDFKIEATEIIAAGDSVVVAVHQTGAGQTSGIATELDYFQVLTFRGDAVIRIESIAQREHALEAVGLPK